MWAGKNVEEKRAGFTLLGRADYLRPKCRIETWSWRVEINCMLARDLVERKSIRRLEEGQIKAWLICFGWHPGILT